MQTQKVKIYVGVDLAVGREFIPRNFSSPIPLDPACSCDC